MLCSCSVAGFHRHLLNCNIILAEHLFSVKPFENKTRILGNTIFFVYSYTDYEQLKNNATDKFDDVYNYLLQ